MSTAFTIKDQNLLRQRVTADLVSQFPAGTFNISVEQLAIVLGICSTSIRNQLCKKTFPIADISIGNRRLFPLTRVIDYLTGLIAPVKSTVGRPTKISRKIEAQEASKLGLSLAEFRAQSEIGGL